MKTVLLSLSKVKAGRNRPFLRVAHSTKSKKLRHAPSLARYAPTTWLDMSEARKTVLGKV